MSRRQHVLAWTILLVVGAVVYLRFGAPMLLFRIIDKAAVDPADRVFTIPNPLRDRARERPAEALLRDIRDGRCEQALASMEPEVIARYCARERELRMTSWRLAHRNDRQTSSVLLFAVHRNGYPQFITGNVWVTVQRRNGVWQATSFDTYY